MPLYSFFKMRLCTELAVSYGIWLGPTIFLAVLVDQIVMGTVDVDPVLSRIVRVLEDIRLSVRDVFPKRKVRVLCEGEDGNQSERQCGCQFLDHITVFYIRKVKLFCLLVMKDFVFFV